VLVQHLKEGKREACTSLVDRYQGVLLREAVSVFSLRRDEAEEVVSDVLLAVVEGIHRFTFKRGEQDFHAWVMTIFRNKVRDHVRQQARRGRMVGFDDHIGREAEDDSEMLERGLTWEVLEQYRTALVEHENTDLSNPYEDPTPAVGKLVAIAEALERLDAWERVLLRCRALDVPYEEIASYTGKPVSHLKVYHARVRKKFVNILAEYYPELTQHETGNH
jgi:RNA polymerase sigma factor (sigma-70 family)